MRRVPSMFSRHIANEAPQMLPISLEAKIWLPALKMKDPKTRQVIRREVLSPTQAKQEYANLVKGVDPWGHAAAEIVVDCRDESSNNGILREKIQELAIVNGAVSLKESRNITGLKCYISLYPDHSKPPTGGFTTLEEREWLDHTRTGHPRVDEGKYLSLRLFNTKYAAINSDYANDVLGYGNPDFTYLFTRNLDFPTILEQCFKMMKPSLKGNTIVLDTASPSAAYYGKAMLNEHRLASILQDGSTPLTPFDAQSEIIHVCTTANLVLFKAGMGDEKYYKFVKKVFEENPELRHGFPITHFAQAFLNTLSRHPDFKNANSVHQEAEISSNTFQKK